MKPRIVVDVMGADRPPAELAAGALRAAEELSIALVLVGNRSSLPVQLPPEVETLDCEDPSLSEGEPTRSSIARGIEALRRGEADAFLSPGSTAAVVRTAVLRLGRLPGVSRPGLCVSLPTLRGEALLIDAGATADPKPLCFPQFAELGTIYAREVLRIPCPTVGLLNIGTEPGKGDALAREAHALLQSRAEFLGNVEPNTLLTERPVDVIVAAGFGGNLLLKALEGGVEAVLDALRVQLRCSLRARLGALLARGAVRAVTRQLRYEEHNAAPLLGVNGLVTIAHGRSDDRGIAGALRRTHRACEARVVEKLVSGGRLSAGTASAEGNARPRVRSAPPSRAV